MHGTASLAREARHGSRHGMHGTTGASQQARPGMLGTTRTARLAGTACTARERSSARTARLARHARLLTTAPRRHGRSSSHEEERHALPRVQRNQYTLPGPAPHYHPLILTMVLPRTLTPTFVVRATINFTRACPPATTPLILTMVLPRFRVALQKDFRSDLESIKIFEVILNRYSKLSSIDLRRIPSDLRMIFKRYSNRLSTDLRIDLQ